MPENTRSHLAKSRETGHSESAITINTQQLQSALNFPDTDGCQELLVITVRVSSGEAIPNITEKERQLVLCENPPRLPHLLLWCL